MAEALVRFDLTPDFMAHLDQQKLLQFLFGLNESFYHTRSQLLLMNPLSSVNQAFSMLSQDESQRLIKNSSNPGAGLLDIPAEPVVAMYSANNTSRPKKDLTCFYCNNKGHKADIYVSKGKGT